MIVIMLLLLQQMMIAPMNDDIHHAFIILRNYMRLARAAATCALPSFARTSTAPVTVIVL